MKQDGKMPKCCYLWLVAAVCIVAVSVWTMS